MGKLSAKNVEHAPRGKHSDGDGLSLLVKPSGARSWVVRVSVADRKRDIGIGPWPAVGLAAARQRRDEIKAEAKAEACLAHTLGNSVEQAYVRQADLFGQRRDVMADWANFASSSRS